MKKFLALIKKLFVAICYFYNSIYLVLVLCSLVGIVFSFFGFFNNSSKTNSLFFHKCNYDTTLFDVNPIHPTLIILLLGVVLISFTIIGNRLINILVMFLNYFLKKRDNFTIINNKNIRQKAIFKISYFIPSSRREEVIGDLYEIKKGLTSSETSQLAIKITLLKQTVIILFFVYKIIILEWLTENLKRITV